MKERVLKHLDKHVGAYQWAGLAGYVVGVNLLAPRTMSSAVDRALEHPVGKYAAMLGVAAIGLHLLNAFEKYEAPDPIEKLWGLVTK